MEENKLAIFEGKHIRKTIHNNKWWFSIIDVIEVLTDSSIPKRYWSDLKRKLVKEGYSELYEKIVQLKFAATDGKFYATDCANTETMLRIIQSIPSPKVEPLKRWLAKIGKERIDEIEDLQLAMERIKELYEKKGYPKGWIDKRMRGIAVRQDLTDEWNNRGVQTNREYAILTNEIMEGVLLTLKVGKQIVLMRKLPTLDVIKNQVQGIREGVALYFNENRPKSLTSEKIGIVEGSMGNFQARTSSKKG